jgi:hypothetical protein
MGMTRKQMEIDTIYRTPGDLYFFSPDGEGRIWYDTEEEIRDATGIVDDVVVLMSEPEDF